MEAVGERIGGCHFNNSFNMNIHSMVNTFMTFLQKII